MSKNGSSVWRKYVDTVSVVDRTVNSLLGSWGSLVATRPVLTIAVSSIVALILSGGLALIGQNLESDGDKLWYVSYVARTFPCAASDFALPPRVTHRIIRVVDIESIELAHARMHWLLLPEWPCCCANAGQSAIGGLISDANGAVESPIQIVSIFFFCP